MACAMTTRAQLRELDLLLSVGKTSTVRAPHDLCVRAALLTRPQAGPDSERRGDRAASTTRFSSITRRA
jgi:hypothetical protein